MDLTFSRGMEGFKKRKGAFFEGERGNAMEWSGGFLQRILKGEIGVLGIASWSREIRRGYVLFERFRR